ncbi:WG repeat-containing protein [Riemerella anatipestifer]|nr:WG repeat-containing protein [Riemerella anatipestifer]MDY3324538.1 WG repeat-containing protein [Riemerella anatipestifer]MDY3353348.1 WG repeat-containing protein [Riemerella anatipestifer]
MKNFRPIKLTLIYLLMSLFSLNAQDLKKYQCKIPDTILYVKNNKFGYYDLKNKKVISKAKFDKAYLFQYDEILGYQDDTIDVKFSANDYATVTIAKSEYRIDKTGKIVYKFPKKMLLPPPFSNEKSKYYTYSEYIGRHNQKWGIKSKEDKNQITNPEYDNLNELYMFDPNNSKFIAKKNGKFGVIDFQGNIIIEIKYDYLYNPREYVWEEDGTILVVKENKKWKVIDLCGNEVKL